MLNFLPSDFTGEDKMQSYRVRIAVAGLVILLSLGAAFAALHNISGNRAVDPARTMFEDFNNGFTRHWKARSGVDVTVRRALGKSGEPVHAVVDGLDVVPLVLSYDMDAFQKSPLFTLPGWQQPSPQNSPFTSTIVFLVRKGNPHNLKGWNDLIRPDIEIVTANPRTSTLGRWGYLAAWGHAFKQSRNSEEAAQEFVKNLFANIKMPEGDAHEALAAFTERGIGDVLIVWENEAHWVAKERGNERLEVVTPEVSILAEPMVSVIAESPDRHGARELTQAYINYLYTPAAQDIAAKHHFRPRDATPAEKYAAQLPPVDLFSVDEVFGGWKQAWNTHFAPGGMLDRLRKQQASSPTTATPNT
jgi:sulfate transport system substrate-binding protein